MCINYVAEKYNNDMFIKNEELIDVMLDPSKNTSHDDLLQIDLPDYAVILQNKNVIRKTKLNPASKQETKNNHSLSDKNQSTNNKKVKKSLNGEINNKSITKIKNTVKNQFDNFLNESYSNNNNLQSVESDHLDTNCNIQNETILNNDVKVTSTSRNYLKSSAFVKSNSFSNLKDLKLVKSEVKAKESEPSRNDIKRPNIVNYDQSKKSTYTEIINMANDLLARLKLLSLYECFILDESRKEFVVVIDKLKYAADNVHLTFDDEYQLFVRKFSYMAVPVDLNSKRSKSEIDTRTRHALIDKTLEFSVVVGKDELGNSIKRNLYVKETNCQLTSQQKFCLKS